MSKRTLVSTAQGPTAKRVRTGKDILPSNFYKECNKIYAQIEASKYDTKEIIKRLVRKSKIDKELGRPRPQISGSRESKSSIVSAAPSPVGWQNALVETDSTQEPASASASASAGAKPNGKVEMKTLVSACLSSLTAVAELTALNKQLLEQHHGSPQPVDEDVSFLDLDFDGVF